MKLKHLLTLVLLAAAGSSLFAQPFTAHPDSMIAQGWSLVRNFDSVGKFGVRVWSYGDTVVMRADRNATVIVSYDGGKTIDHPFTFPSDQNLDGYLFSHDPIYVEIPNYLSGGDTLKMYITTDLGQTYSERIIDLSNIKFGFSSYMPGLVTWMDPTANGTFYIEFQASDPNFPAAEYIRSEDTGKSWEKVTLPDPLYRTGYYRETYMDVRQHGLWYTVVGDKEGLSQDWYRTKDNGATFEQTGHGSGTDYSSTLDVGIGYPGEIRDYWGPELDIHRGVRSLDTLGNVTILDWVDSLLPGRPDTLRSAHGNRFGFNIYYYAPSNPDFLLLPVEESYRRLIPKTDTSFVERWYYSRDRGKDWEKVWEDSTYIVLSMDTRYPNIIWAILALHDSTHTYNVYRKDFGLSSAVNQPIGVTRDYSVIENPNYVELEGPFPAQVTLSVFDILGRKVSDGYTRASAASVRWTIPAAVPSGSYFLIVRDGFGRLVASAKVILR